MRVQKRDRLTFTLELSQMSHFNNGNINMNINIYIYMPSVRLSCRVRRIVTVVVVCPSVRRVLPPVVVDRILCPFCRVPSSPSLSSIRPPVGCPSFRRRFLSVRPLPVCFLAVRPVVRNDIFPESITRVSITCSRQVNTNISLI